MTESGTIGKFAFNTLKLNLLNRPRRLSNGAAAFTKGKPTRVSGPRAAAGAEEQDHHFRQPCLRSSSGRARRSWVSKTIAWNTLVGGQANSSLKSLCSGGKTNGTIDKGEECEPTDVNPASYTTGACTNACRAHPGFGAAVALCGDFLLVGAPGLGKPVSSASEGAQLKGTKTFSVGGVWLVKRDDKGVWGSSKDPLYRGGARLKKGEMNTPHVGLKGTFDCSGITAAIGDPSADQGEGVVRIYDMAGNYLTEKLKVEGTPANSAVRSPSGSPRGRRAAGLEQRRRTFGAGAAPTPCSRPMRRWSGRERVGCQSAYLWRLPGHRWRHHRRWPAHPEHERPRPARCACLSGQ